MLDAFPAVTVRDVFEHAVKEALYLCPQQQWPTSASAQVIFLIVP